MNENHEHEFPDELISAYLDGELSPAEKLRVEEQLMDSAEHRRLFEELKSLRRSLQALPAEALGEDFAARVLRRAERELLAAVPVKNDGPAPSKLPVAKATDAIAPAVEEKKVVVVREKQLDRASRRGLVWSIVATAAAVGFLIYGPLQNQQSPHQVSQLDEKVGERASPEPTSAPAAGERRRAPLEEVGPLRGAEKQLSELQNKNDMQSAGAAPVSAPAPGNGFALRDSETAKQEANSPPENAMRTSGPDRFEQQRTAIRGGARASTAPKDRAGASETAEKAMPEKIAEQTAALGKASSDASYAAQPTPAGGSAIASAPPPSVRRSRQDLALAVAPRAMSVVTVDMKREALSAKFFDHLLARHSIQVELASAEGEELEQQGQDPQDATAESFRDEVRVGDKDEGKPLIEGGIGGGAGQGAAAFGAVASAKADQEDVDLMYVVATQEQIDDLLRDLQSRHDDVVALTYGDDILAKKNFLAKANALQAERLLHDGAEVKELAQSDDSPRPSALAQPAPEADALKPAQPKLEAEQADRVVDSAAEAESAAPADEAKLADLQSANARKLGFARRLSLQDSKAQGNMAARNENRAIESPAAAATGVASQPTREAATAAADSLEEVQGGPQADAALADSAVEGAPAAPPSSPVATLAKDGRDRLKKSKEQGLVRVLFVLRAVSPAPVTEAEAAPAEAAGEPQQ